MILPSDEDSRKPGDSNPSGKPGKEPDPPEWEGEDDGPKFFDEEHDDPYGPGSPVESPAPPGWRKELKQALLEAVDDLKEIEDPDEDFDPPEPPDLFTFYAELVAMRNELRRGARKSADAMKELAAGTTGAGGAAHSPAAAIVYLFDRLTAGEKKLKPLLESAMRQAGIERIVTAGVKFDPVTMTTDDTCTASSKVASELEAGFLWNGRVLRPARVTLR